MEQNQSDTRVALLSMAVEIVNCPMRTDRVDGIEAARIVLSVADLLQQFVIGSDEQPKGRGQMMFTSEVSARGKDIVADAVAALRELADTIVLNDDEGLAQHAPAIERAREIVARYEALIRGEGK